MKKDDPPYELYTIFQYDAVGVKGYYHDENGNQIVDYQWNSAETEIRTGFQNYPVYQNSRDEVNGGWTDQTWTYEMGAGKSEYAPEKNQPVLNSGKQNVRYPQRFRPQTFRQEIKELREQSYKSGM